MLSRLRQTNSSMYDLQRQISTGLKQSVPSDDPSATSGIMFLQDALSSRSQYQSNLNHALAVLNDIDQALGESNNILVESQTIASSLINASTEEREAEALVIDAQLQAMMDIGNLQLNGLSIFGGNAGAADNGLIFEAFLGGIRYTGSDENLAADSGVLEEYAFTSNGVEAFGALSARVASIIDLDPDATVDTKINTLDGVKSLGVTLGEVSLTVDGTQVMVDLSDANTLGDVLSRLNLAIDDINPAAGWLALGTTGFELTNTAGHTIVIDDIGNGRVATDLGLELTAIQPGGVTRFGGDVQPRLTLTTELSDLGPAIDLASGLLITQGEQTRTADFSSANTVQDLVNEIDRLQLGLRLEINDEGTGLNLVSEVSGISLSVGENGGTTASDLGIRTYGPNTSLSDFRNGLGIEPITGQDDMLFTVNNGMSFGVDASGLGTVDELITAIEDAATAAGLTVGVNFSVDYVSSGNGLVFTDNTAGINGFTIERVGESLVADQLGMLKEDGTALTFTSSDEAMVRVENVFTHLTDLRDALLNDDTLGITIAAGKLDVDTQQVTQARATVGVRAQRVERQIERSEDLKLMEETMLSDLRDADLTEVITRYSQLQVELQASLQIGAQNLQYSLLDFLR